MRIESKCYCCPQPATTADNAMDLDAALNELGMLSAVPDSRRQYLQEKARRDSLEKSRGRNLSEPSLGSLVTATPSNSPIKSAASTSQSPSSVYHVLKLNPQYVVSLSSGTPSGQPTSQNNYFPSTSSYDLNAACYSSPQSSSSLAESSHTAETNTVVRSITFGAKYSQENIDYQVRNSRTAKLRLSRLKRFKKPYEVPWLSNAHRYNISYPAPMAGPSLVMPSTAAQAPRAAENLGNSCTSTPEKPAEGGTFSRSKSLDELDFSKLRLAEAENHNFILEKKEIENVSQNLQKLHVYE